MSTAAADGLVFHSIALHHCASFFAAIFPYYFCGEIGIMNGLAVVLTLALWAVIIPTVWKFLF
jgi:hypothetical protein